jgi:hypothetical protein
MPGLNAKYLYRQLFDATRLTTGISKFLSTQPLAQGNGPDSAANAAKTINRLSLDARVNDIRFMAYMLATIMVEARETQPYERPVLKKGIQQVDPKTKLPLTKIVQLWDLFDPATEMGFGKGRDYYEPVKVAQIADGAIITEKDGQQFKVDLAGNKFVEKGTSTKAKVGSPSGGKATDKYAQATGDEHQYYGRGLVQLTWWNGYAATSAAMGRKLELLFNPEKMLEFDTSYEVMVVGMTTGIGYANGNKLSDYINDAATDYKSARAIINGTDRAADIAKIALAAEAMLMDARAVAAK